MDKQTFNQLPLTQRKAHQQRLKESGHYAGDVDGEWGPGTETAFKLRDEGKEKSARQEREGRIAETQAEAEAEKAKAEADRIRAQAEAERLRSIQSQQYAEQANSPEGVATTFAANTVAPVSGVALGRMMGLGLNALADRSQDSRNFALQGAAQDRLDGRTTREGARVGTERSGALPPSNSFQRVTGRMLPHAITGGAMIGKGGLLLADEGGESFYADQANQAAGLGMIGTGAGLLERGAAYAVNPGVSPDARSIAIMESNQLRRNPAAQAQANRLQQAQDAPPAPQAPAPRATPAPGSKAALQQQAKGLNVPGRSQMNKAQLAEAVAEALRQEGGKRTIGKRAKAPPKSAMLGPLAAASLAYALTPDKAQAFTGQSAPQMPQGHPYSGSPEDDFAYGQGVAPGGVNEQALTNAGLAGGVAYGAGKLMDAVPQSLVRALSAGMPMLAPQMGADMMDPTQGELDRGRNWAARNLPESMQFAKVAEAREMAQVPERNPERAARNGLPAKLVSRVQSLKKKGAPDHYIADYLNRAMP